MSNLSEDLDDVVASVSEDLDDVFVSAYKHFKKIHETVPNIEGMVDDIRRPVIYFTILAPKFNRASKHMKGMLRKHYFDEASMDKDKVAIKKLIRECLMQDETNLFYKWIFAYNDDPHSENYDLHYKHLLERYNAEIINDNAFSGDIPTDLFLKMQNKGVSDKSKLINLKNCRSEYRKKVFSDVGRQYIKFQTQMFEIQSFENTNDDAPKSPSVDGDGKF